MPVVKPNAWLFSVIFLLSSLLSDSSEKSYAISSLKWLGLKGTATETRSSESPVSKCSKSETTPTVMMCLPWLFFQHLWVKREDWGREMLTLNFSSPHGAVWGGPACLWVKTNRNSILLHRRFIFPYRTLKKAYNTRFGTRMKIFI